MARGGHTISAHGTERVLSSDGPVLLAQPHRNDHPAGTRIDIDDEAERGGLTIAVAALLATEVFHIAATVANDSQPTAHHAQVGRPAHVLAVVLTAGLLVWIRRRGAHARTLTGIAGAAVAAAALIYHVLPIDSDYLNPFRDGATTVQWISVVAGVVAGAWCAAVGFRAPKRETPPSSLAT